MNIAFVTTFKVSPEKGGTERTTLRISGAFRKGGNRCYNLYAKEIDKKLPPAEFDGVFNIYQINLKDFSKTYNIDIFVFEGAFEQLGMVRNALGENRTCKLVFVHHFEPGSEVYFELFRDIKAEFLHSNSVAQKFKQMSKICLYPLYRPYKVHKAHANYKLAYDICDKVVLLSAEYIYKYCSFGGVSEKEKFAVIPNAITFDEFIQKSEFTRKKKQVLIVTRLEETQKRISLAIRIWKMIEQMPELSDWTLKVVGFGNYEAQYKKLAKGLRLERIFFEGRQDPRPYYRESSLFMMTSLYEGWPMTINESLQFGCVPFAFDVIPSLHDIIENGKNGCLLREMDLVGYAQKMKEIMLDDEKREELMEKCLETSKLYSLDNIYVKWKKLLNEL